MRTSRTGGVCLALAALIGAAPAGAAEQEGPVVAEILEVLKERGIVDQAEYQRMAAKNARYEEERATFLPKISWSGDFRFRHESFFFDEDATGSERRDRFRIRYRLRLNGQVEVNDWADVVFMLVSGGADQRSTNQTLGSGVDFDTDDIRLDRAYARLRAPSEWVPLGGAARLEMGKVPNPFVWKVGKDFMLWDHDINLEGVSLLWDAKPMEATDVFATFGYYIIDENSRRNDPHMWALQVGAHHEASETLTLGGRATWYEFRSVDTAFLGRGAAGGPNSDGGGNVRDGLTGSAGGDPLRVLEAAAYLTWTGVEDWPMTLYGDFSKNIEASRSALYNAGENDTAWGVGFEVGDKKRFAKLGVGWWHVEANAFPSQFIDSDLFDGFTNREGFAVYASRTVLRNTDLNLTLFKSREIEDGIVPASDSIVDADRIRIQADMIFKF